MAFNPEQPDNKNNKKSGGNMFEREIREDSSNEGDPDAPEYAVSQKGKERVDEIMNNLSGDEKEVVEKYRDRRVLESLLEAHKEEYDQIIKANVDTPDEGRRLKKIAEDFKNYA